MFMVYFIQSMYMVRQNKVLLSKAKNTTPTEGLNQFFPPLMYFLFSLDLVQTEGFP